MGEVVQHPRVDSARMRRLRDQLLPIAGDLDEVVAQLRARIDLDFPVSNRLSQSYDTTRLADAACWTPPPIVTELPRPAGRLRTWLKRWAARVGR